MCENDHDIKILQHKHPKYHLSSFILTSNHLQMEVVKTAD